MKLLIFLCLFLLTATQAHALTEAEAIALFHSSHLANKLKSVKTMGELPSVFSARPADEKMYRADLEKTKMQDQAFPEVQQQSSKVVIGTSPHQIEIDFKEISTKSIYLNQKKYVYKKAVSYVEAKRIINDVVGSSMKTSLIDQFLPKAFAEEHPIATLSKAAVAWVMADNYVPRLDYTKSFGLEETIIQSYEEYVDWTFERDQKKLAQPKTNPKKVHLNSDYNGAPTFTCKGKELDQVLYNTDLIKMGQKTTPDQRKPDPIVTQNPNKTFTVESFRGECKTFADPEGKVLKSRESCPMFKTTIFEVPVAHFPKVAAACCAKEGCAEKVQAGLNKILDSQVRRSQEFKKQLGVK